MPTLVVVEILSGIVAILLTGVALVNYSWVEGASAYTMKQESLRRAKRLGLAAVVFWAITGICAYVAMR